MFYQTVIEPEPDDCGRWHAIVIEAEADTVIHITDSHASLADAIRAAQAWLDQRGDQPCVITSTPTSKN
jgi:hypothetical protein